MTKTTKKERFTHQARPVGETGDDGRVLPNRQGPVKPPAAKANKSKPADEGAGA